MRIRSRLLLLFLIVSMLLCACMAPANDMEPTAAPDAAATEPAAEPEETEPQFAAVEMPETDAATGALLFYFGGSEIHAGAPMSQLIHLGIYTDQDLEKMVQPGHTSEVLNIRIDLEDKSLDDDPLIFVVAVNSFEEPRMVSQCVIYSITVNTEKGISFGSGHEAEPFVTGTTTREQLTAAYGEPGFSRSGNAKFEEIAYYRPFNSAYFTFKDGVVRQIVTCYSAELFADRTEDFAYDLGGAYFGSDSAILMSRYLDAASYLAGTAAAEKLEALAESIVMDGQTIELGMRAADMPTPFGEPFVSLTMPLTQRYYVRTGRGNEEEFYLLNWNGQKNSYADNLLVKGVITENRDYANWGKDNSEFHTFEYMGLTNSGTIEDVLEIFGLPMEIQFNSTGRLCDAWLFYEDVKGNTLRVRVDPMLDQVVEIRVEKFYSGARMYQ